ncbi:helix-turn-helix domain-containing protein [Ferrovibrio sp.]|uniref:helix-turn-helix domain-containing protein n=1 Tax=Ferrovibrio sp. TaxID=1917215 RepID=UPI003D148E4F
MPNRKPPHPIDIEAGRRLRAARQLAGINQTQLGNHVGITFQQVQKYEKGLNRISASRLSLFGQLLNVPPSYFFGEDTPAIAEPVQATPGSLTRTEAKLVRQFRAAPGEFQRAVSAMLDAAHQEAAR